MADKAELVTESPRTISPLIFISHDTRDADLAEAFSKLLGSVSAGVLKSFRSSDKRGNQGIEYGVEWFPEIMKKLELASDVVCLLTPNSIGRPWILYEAGVAKGKLDTPVHGLALGIPLSNASTGPFAQFQNSDDSEDALTQLVMQLVRRIPGSEPDRDVVRSQVSGFRSKALTMTKADAGGKDQAKEADGASVAKLFEEVKVMFQDLPSRIESRIDPEYAGGRRKRRPTLGMMHELMYNLKEEAPGSAIIRMAASQFKDDMPWFYDTISELSKKIDTNDKSSDEAINQIEKLFNLVTRHPIFRDMEFKNKDRWFEFGDSCMMAMDFVRHMRKKSPTEAASADIAVAQVKSGKGGTTAA